MGEGEINYFIFTFDVDILFSKIIPLFNEDAKKVLKAAYREVDGEDFTILYPPGLTEFDIA